MELTFNKNIVDNYKSNTQKARIITETWMVENMYCPICGNPSIEHFRANKPVADFFCPCCNSEYELKSSKRKKESFQRIIPNGAYSTLIKRIESFNNPHLFVMAHYGSNVHNLIMIPNFFFIPDIVIKRPPLGENARRHGWEGSNINLGMIPDFAKIPIIKNLEIIPIHKVLSQYNHLNDLQFKSLDARGWIIDTMRCLEKIPGKEFKLEDVYKFETELKQKYPNNNFIKEKLRQQLQILRNKGIIEFISRGCYKKVIHE